MWDKLEVIYEETNKVKEVPISSLVNEYVLFKMEDKDNVQNFFSRFSKIICDMKSLRMIYSNRLQIKKLIESLSEARGNQDSILEDEDLQKMTYD